MPELSAEWYREQGVEPPTHEPHGTEAEIAEAMSGQKVRHEWRQMGSRLVCIACPLEHSTEAKFTNYLLQGTDANGLPILRKV